MCFVLQAVWDPPADYVAWKEMELDKFLSKTEWRRMKEKKKDGDIYYFNIDTKDTSIARPPIVKEFDTYLTDLSRVRLNHKITKKVDQEQKPELVKHQPEKSKDKTDKTGDRGDTNASAAEKEEKGSTVSSSVSKMFSFSRKQAPGELLSNNKNILYF
jgi:hypothetical protein